ncbi:hypothetical protein [Metabacillus indicus]|uniref:hypothetical protein n=1 Tax=Metabacillus indicus TaxID=246786 RepID=UPI003CEEB6AB
MVVLKNEISANKEGEDRIGGTQKRDKCHQGRGRTNWWYRKTRKVPPRKGKTDLVSLKKEISTTKEVKNRFGGTAKHESVIQTGDPCIDGTMKP